MGSYVSQEQQKPVEVAEAPELENPSTPVRPARAFRGLSLTDSPSVPSPMSPGTQTRIMVDPRSPNRTRTPVAEKNRRRGASASEAADPRSPGHTRSPLKIHGGFNQQENSAPNQRGKKIGRIGITSGRGQITVEEQEN